MANTFLERLRSGAILIADGATGTNFQQRGLGLGVPPDEWVFEAPEKVIQLHRDFIDAGSNIILTDSFGGTRIRMAETRYADRAAELNRRAAELAREAAGTLVFVAGSMGPTGSLFEPIGTLTHAPVVEAYAEQAAALTAGGADFLLVETMFAFEEALAAIEGAKQGSDLPIVCSFSFDLGLHTMMGIQPAQVAQRLKPLGLAAIGANCGKSLDFMEQVVHQLVVVAPGVPVWAKPNAGMPVAGLWPPEYDVGPEEMGEYAVRFISAGAQIVGGCCGSTPAHVRAIANAVLAYQNGSE